MNVKAQLYVMLSDVSFSVIGFKSNKKDLLPENIV